jgi:hypothetical protein
LFSGAGLAFAAPVVMASAGQSKPMAAAKTMVACIEKSETGSLTLAHAMPNNDMEKSSMVKGAWPRTR